ncbi:PIR protein [Plasmodium yoelii]|uniref:PIR protein n=2 Tax=Plasmodium yoelii TaxID=5861 RepID=A0AAE9WRP3_PLAYO|nr:PIR protein [Plasmodium yoelii]WBY55862.1 PIR protein [Plasmodium yoelii yoelii]CDS44370.1 YIR protein [Plasmodium yoelii]VTZ75090.1 PIR protein [Plasmodium yoelii]|eukprot:XP_034493426.1 PIR protein [Plasmodium yoelii]
MDANICKRFKDVWEWISDELNGGKYQFNDNDSLNNKFSNNYCNNDDFSDSYCDMNFQNDFYKISAGCLYLLNEFFRDSSTFKTVAKSNINIVDYIMIWLSYMLNLTNSEEKNNITCFYIAYMNDCDKYNKEINELTDYKSYKDLLDKKNEVLNMDSNDASKFYKAFKLLCEMYTGFDENTSNCTNCLEKAEEFVKIHKELNDPNNAKYIGYCQAFSTLSNDYKNLKNKYNSLPEIDTKETDAICSEKNSKQDSEQLYAQGYEDTSSSSSIASKLIPVLLIFAAIPIFLGISYKYSLFGFRKRFQKQKLREKLKNVKKRMNH